MADYGESILIDLEVRNVGIAQANSIMVKLSSQDAFISLIDTTEFYGNILPDSVLMITSAFSLEVDDSIPDGHSCLIYFYADDGTNTWSGAFTIKLHAPALEFDDYSISDPTGNNNNKIDAGETIDMTIVIKNNGSAEAFNVKGILSAKTSNGEPVKENSSLENVIKDSASAFVPPITFEGLTALSVEIKQNRLINLHVSDSSIKFFVPRTFVKMYSEGFELEIGTCL